MTKMPAIVFASIIVGVAANDATAVSAASAVDRTPIINLNANKDATSEDEGKYQACMQTVARDPAAGFEEANGWFDRGGGFPARYCIGAALRQLGKPRAAGDFLSTLARDMQAVLATGPAAAASRRVTPALTADILDESAMAYLAADMPGKADTLAAEAVKLDDKNAALWVDQAIVLGGMQRYNEAVAALDKALKLAPSNDEALILRATALRLTQQNDAAFRDISAALAHDPTSIEALLERGQIYLSLNKVSLARADWLALIAAAPTSHAADLARTHLETLDVKTGD